MKKTYTKPEIMFEDFSLNNSITAGCEVIVDAPSQGTCAYTVVSGRKTNNIFLSTMSLCDTYEDDGEFNGLCYHVFTDGADSLFNS